MTARIQQTSFAGSGGDRLDARLDLPDGDPIAFALFAHCFTCSKESPAATHIARGLVERGIGVLRFDFTGLGSSAGEFKNTNFSSNVEDLVRAAGMLRERYAAPKLLVGHSLGGAAVLAAASAIPEAVAVATIAAPFDPGAEVARLLYVADVLAAWSSRYVEASTAPIGASTPAGTVVVSDASMGRLAQRIRAGHHTLVADEPVEIGDDTGPAPYDLLLASLGACTAMTLRMYAERKGWPLEKVAVRLRHDRVHAADARGYATGRPMIDRIDVVLDLDGPLTDEQLHRLLEIAERCPVHRTLVGEKQIVTRLESESATSRGR